MSLKRRKKKRKKKTNAPPVASYMTLNTPSAEDMYEVNKSVPELHGMAKDPIGGSANPETMLAAREWVHRNCVFAGGTPSPSVAPPTPAGPTQKMAPGLEQVIKEYAAVIDEVQKFVFSMERAQSYFHREYYLAPLKNLISSVSNAVPQAHNLDSADYGQVSNRLIEKSGPLRRPTKDPSTTEESVKEIGTGARELQEGISGIVGMMEMNIRPEIPYLDPNFEFSTLDIKKVLKALKDMVIRARNPGPGKYSLMMTKIQEALTALYQKLSQSSS